MIRVKGLGLYHEAFIAENGLDERAAEALKNASNLAGDLINEVIAKEDKEKEVINLQNQE